MYLKEVQGLRVVAALLVAVYHIWFMRVSGGVDAFFVIAGFFLYRSLFKSGAPGWAQVLAFYQRTCARVFPSASVVIAATCAMFYLADIDSLWPSQIKSALAAMLFVENWWLASESTNYLARGEVPSPFQQMWALSVQMQLYIVVPVLLLVAGRLAKGSPPRVAAIIVVLLVAAFGYAIFETARNQPFAYFNTAARLWEFLAGATLAYALPYVRLPEAIAKLVGYAALLVLMLFAALLPVGSLFPGFAALIPVLATATIIVAATSGGNLGALNAPIMQRLGDISFTFYLWHWPLLILYWQVWGEGRPGLLAGLAIIVVSGVLAHLTYLWAEAPFRRSGVAKGPARWAIPASAALMIPAVLAVGWWALSYFQDRDAARADLAAFLRGDAVAAAVVPATVIGKSDVPTVYRKGCIQRRQTDVIECAFGNPEGRFTVALVGGSHSAQWHPTLVAAARRIPEMRLVTMLRGGCPLAITPEAMAELDVNEDCLEWSRGVLARLDQLQPDAVVTLLSTTRRVGEATKERIPAAFHAVWDRLDAFPVLAIRDTPRKGSDILNCVDRMGFDHARCTILEEQTLVAGLVEAAELPAHIHPLDLSNSFCRDGACPPVWDGMLVYRDASHVTVTYAKSFAPRFTAALIEMGVLAPGDVAQ